MHAVLHHQDFLLDDSKVISCTKTRADIKIGCSVSLLLSEVTWFQLDDFDGSPVTRDQSFGLNGNKTSTDNSKM